MDFIVETSPSPSSDRQTVADLDSDASQSAHVKRTITCAVTQEVISEDHTPIRIIYDAKNADISIEITRKHHKNAVYVQANNKTITLLVKQSAQDDDKRLKTYFPFPIAQFAFKDLRATLLSKLEKKICASLGFAFKTKKAFYGNRAVQRHISRHPEEILAILISKTASDEMSQKFVRNSLGINIMSHFPHHWLQKVTGREKISFLVILKGSVTSSLYQDYLQYSEISTI
ncbi:MAG: hypothetical protein AAF621_02375 [Pseudomonadota bacterium]